MPEVLKNKSLKGEKAVRFFRRGFFWDCVQDEILVDSDYDLIIVRVLSRSANLSKDLLILDSIYPRSLIISIALEKSGQIFGVEQIEEIAGHYKMNPKQFRRYFKR